MASIVVRFIGLLYRIPLTRILGDEAMGYYSTAFEFYNLALLLSSYSLPLAVSKLVSVREVKGQYRNAGKVFGMAMLFGLGVGTVATLVVYFGADAYARFNYAPQVAYPLRVLAPTIFVFSFMGVIRGYFQGHSNMVPTAISQVIEQIVNAGVSIGASVYIVRRFRGDANLDGYGAAGGTMGTFAGAVAAAIFLVIMYFIYRPAFRMAQQSDAGEYLETNGQVAKAIVATVVPVIISQTVYQISGNIDITIFHRVMEQRGFSDSVRSAWWSMYSNKYRLLSNVPVAIASAMGTAIVPGLIAEYSRMNYEGVRERIASAVKFNMLIAIPCAAGLSVLAAPILKVLFSDTNETSVQMLTIGGIAVVFFALSTVTNGVLQGIDRMKTPVWHSAIALLLHVILLYALLQLTSWNGLVLVVCNIFFALIVCILNLWSIGRYLDYRQEYVRTFVLPTVAAVVMGAVAYGVHFGLSQCLPELFALIGAIAAAVVVYALGLLVLGAVTREELLEMPMGARLVRLFGRFQRK